VQAKHNNIVKNLIAGETNKESIIQDSLKSLADALLVNLLQNEYQAKDLLGSEEQVGLEAIMVPLKNLFSPPSDTLIYERARDCFMEIFVNFVKGSEDIIPGSDTTYTKLLESIRNIPESVRTSKFKLNEEDSEAEETVSAPIEEKKEIAKEIQPAEEQDLNEIEAENENEENEGEEDEEKEVIPEETYDPKKVLKQDSVKTKKFVDEDGFIQVKPEPKNKFEKKVLKGRGRRTGGKAKKEDQRQRAKVDRGRRGAREYRGRGKGREPHDKFGTDDSGKKSKTAHGKHMHWSKGEVRMQKPTE